MVFNFGDKKTWAVIPSLKEKKDLLLDEAKKREMLRKQKELEKR